MSRVEGSPSRRRRVAWLIACAAGAALTDRVHAAGRIYTAGTSNWNNSTNWFLLPTGGPGVPFSGDDQYPGPGIENPDRAHNFCDFQ